MSDKINAEMLAALKGLYETGAPEGISLTAEEMRTRFDRAKNAIQAAEAELSNAVESSGAVDDSTDGRPKFRVHLQRYVEQTATVIVTALDVDDAIDKALDFSLGSPTWADGDDEDDAAAYSVMDESGATLWER